MPPDLTNIVTGPGESTRKLAPACFLPLNAPARRFNTEPLAYERQQ